MSWWTGIPVTCRVYAIQVCYDFRVNPVAAGRYRYEDRGGQSRVSRISTTSCRRRSQTVVASPRKLALHFKPNYESPHRLN